MEKLICFRYSLNDKHFHCHHIQILILFLVQYVELLVYIEDRNKIPDARMTASTYYYSSHYPYYGRLNGSRGNGAWCAKTTTGKTDYLQVDMGVVQSVCAVATQGHRTGTARRREKQSRKVFQFSPRGDGGLFRQ